MMAGMLSIQLSYLKNTNDLAPKVEILSEKKLTFLSKSKCILEIFEKIGISKRLSALISSLESCKEVLLIIAYKSLRTL
tara:strand:+ start:181 stop:417 length:237 start_codon:yes stop_codon:yes gene_type:complete